MYRTSSSRADVPCSRSARARSQARIRSLLEVLAVLLLLCASQASAQEERRIEKPEVRAIRAYFYYPTEGAFDLAENGLNDGTAALWNVVAGGGAARHATATTLVLVDLTSPGSPDVRRGSVELVALDGDRELLRSKVPLASIPTGDDGRTTVPFLVHGTGCAKLKLFATLEWEGNRTDRSTAIPFRCGE
jgi:hypothetical protein